MSAFALRCLPSDPFALGGAGLGGRGPVVVTFAWRQNLLPERTVAGAVRARG